MRSDSFAGLLLLCACASASLLGCASQGGKSLKPVDGRDAVLTLWGGGKEDLAKAKSIGVRQLISFSASPAVLAPLVREGRKYDIAILGCVTLPYYGNDLPKQQLNAEEDAFRARVLADKTKEKDKYQFGGEPFHSLEVLDLSICCFHHDIVREKVMKLIHDVVMVDGISGVAFDFFGYANYRCCRCPTSMALAERYHAEHPELTEAQALDAFSLGSLVAFYNDMADYARSLRPGIRVACHVHPVFLPDLYYGNRLKLDECCQTAAWFVEPYWSKERIEEHVRVIFGQEKAYWPLAEGAALLGTACTEDHANPPKSPERVEFELRTMLAAGADRIHVCSGGDLMRSPEHMAVFKRIFAPDSSAAAAP